MSIVDEKPLMKERGNQTKVGDKPSLESSNEHPPKLIVNTAAVAGSPHKNHRYGADGKGFDELVLESKIAEEDLKFLDTSPISKQKQDNADAPSALTLHDPSEAAGIRQQFSSPQGEQSAAPALTIKDESQMGDKVAPSLR